LAYKGNEMEERQQDSNSFQLGDKIRIRSGPFAGARGVVHAGIDGQLEIQLDSGDIIQTVPEEITNYSLAARRAWQSMPKRAGRPQLSTPRKKMVSMRLDIDVWDRLGNAVELGLINSREEAVNVWLREKLDALPIKQQDSDI
jgi:hypothetical protein